MENKEFNTREKLLINKNRQISDYKKNIIMHVVPNYKTKIQTLEAGIRLGLECIAI